MTLFHSLYQKLAKRRKPDSAPPAMPPMGKKIAALWEEGVRLQNNGRLARAFKTFTKKEARLLFKQASVPLTSIDPIGRCACKDFVAVAKTRRPRVLHYALHQVSGSTRAKDTFPMSELDLDTVYSLAVDRGCSCGSGRVRCTELWHSRIVERLTGLAAQMGRHGETRLLAQYLIELSPEAPEGYLHLAKAMMAETVQLLQLPSSQVSQTSQEDAGRKKGEGKVSKDSKVGKDGKDIRERAEAEAAEAAEAEAEAAEVASLFSSSRTPPKLPPMTMDDARFTARCIYTHGMYNVRQHGDGKTHMAKVLYFRCQKYSCGDYIPGLPVEIAENIFGHLQLTDLIRCYRVSKTWAAFVPKMQVRLKTVGIGVAASPTAKKVTHFLRRFPHLDANRLYVNSAARKTDDSDVCTAILLHSFARVETFVIRLAPVMVHALQKHLGSNSLVYPRMRMAPLLLSRCQKLVLLGVRRQNQEAVRGLIECAGPSLESLVISGDCIGPVHVSLPKLTRLEAQNMQWNIQVGSETLPSICMAAPNLKQLYLENVMIKGPFETSQVYADYDPTLALRSLEVLVVEQGQPQGTVFPFAGFVGMWGIGIPFPLLPPTMRCIDLNTTVSDTNQGILVAVLSSSGSIDDESSAIVPGVQFQGRDFRGHYFAALSDQVSQRRVAEPLFPHLECLRILEIPEDMADVLFEQIVYPCSGPDGRLVSLELGVRGLEQAFLRNPLFSLQLPHRIRNLGLYNSDWDRNPGIPGYFAGRTMLTYLERFPNVQSASLILESLADRPQMLTGLVELLMRRKRKSGGGDGAGPSRAEPQPLRTIFDDEKSFRTFFKPTQFTALEAKYGVSILPLVNGRRPCIFPFPEAGVEVVYDDCRLWYPGIDQWVNSEFQP